MKKRITSVILALAMVLALMPMSITATDFSDVRSSDYYAEAAENLAEKDILAGYPDGTFGAGRLITRAEMATIICRMLDKESEALKSAGKTDFDDVSADHWASGYINVASDEGIVNGDGDGKFRPGDNVKHEEAIKMVVCALGLDDDIDINPDDWSAGYLQKADEMGISDNLKGSKGNAATRGDVAVMVYNGLQSDDEVPADDEEPTDIEVSADIEAPTASLKAGTYTGLRDVTLKTATKGADIYYTTDGTTPTTGSTKYTKAISISDTCTLKAIAVKNGAASSDVMSVDYTIKKNTGGGGSGSSTVPIPTPEQGEFKVSFDLNYEGAIGDPQEQKVKNGNYAEAPEQPSRNDFAFIGWFVDKNEQDWKNTFSFEENPINANTTLYAKWIDLTLDTDGDKLLDELEIYANTDINNKDTDGDGITDFQEITELGTDPLKSDTDDDNVNDFDEDFDEDNISNGEEYRIGTSPKNIDSDGDTLGDFDEINIHNTSPVKSDTDGDGATDDWEINNGHNPSEHNSSFNVSEVSEAVSASNPVSAKVELPLKGNQVNTLTVESVSPSQNALVSSEIPGYMGSAYDFKVDGEISSAKLTFQYDTSLGTIGDDFQPRIYYLNEETNMLEELPNQTVENGNVSVQTTHFSIYILLNKVEFDEVWSTEIKPPVDDEEQSGKDHLDVVLVIDSSGSMGWNDPQDIRKTVAKEFVSKLGENDMAAVIDFDSSAYLYSGFTSDKETLNTAIDRINDSGGTNLGSGISLAIEQFTSSETYEPSTAHKYIIMLTDGDGSYNNSLTTTASENDIVIYTIGLGNGVEESVLKSMAEGTGGQYYFASTADNLYDIFDVVIEETIDYTTDSNEDGIPDYFAKLIYDGILVLGNGSAEFMGVDFESNADFDGDGLRNGEELQIVTKGNRVYMKMNSDPMTPNSDGDNMDDKQEVSAGSDPMKYSFKKSAVEEINNHSNYYYSLKAEQFNGDDFYIFIQSINAVIYGVWDVEEVFRDQMIDYFYTYSGQDYVNQMQMEYAKQATVDMITENISSITSAMKDIELVGGRLSECTEYLPEIQKLAALKKEAKILKGRINALAPTDEYSKLTKLLDDDYVKLLDNIKVIENSTGGKIQLKVNKIAKKYTKFMNSTVGNTDLEVGTTISLGFDLIETGIDIADTIVAFSKINANSAAFERNYDILSNLALYGNRQFTRDAAMVIINAFKDEYGSYGDELKDAITKDTVSGCVNMLISLASQNPYVGAVILVRDGIALITGIKDDIIQLYQIVCLYDMTCSAIWEFNASVDSFENYLYVRDEQTFDSVRLLNHVAQMRMVGENKYIDFMAYGGLLGLITDNSETEEKVGLTIKALKSNANTLGLKILDVE